jgi:Chaperone of endosialidase
MSVTINSIDANSDTFASWVAITNQMAQTISNSVVTANTSEGVTGNSTVNFNSKLWGKFAANTILVGNTITSNVTGANVAIEANLELKSAFKLYTVGDLSVKGNIIIDTTAKLRFGDRSSTYSGTTGWLRANSTGYAAFANLEVKGTDLDPDEFVLTSNIGYANSTNSTYDVICYDTSASKWLRTRLTHLLSQEIDALKLGTVTANATAGEVRVNANTNFGGSTSSLFVSNTVARIGVGGITSPQAPLHVQGAVYATGDITAFYTSDANLKKNVTPIANALEKVRWLKGVHFEWDKDKIAGLEHVGPKPDKDIGLIAQDVEKVFPQAVTERSDGYKAVDYTKLVPVLIEAVKELSYRINILEAEMEEKYRSSSR